MLEFTDKVVKTIQVPVEITEQDIEAVIVGAFEGGSNYWMGLANTGEDWENKPNGEPLSTWATKLLLDGKEITLFDIEKTEEELEESKDEEEVVDQGIWTLTLDKLLKGIELNNTERPSKSDKENWDGCDYDCILQYALFGEVVFG